MQLLHRARQTRDKDFGRKKGKGKGCRSAARDYVVTYAYAVPVLLGCLGLTSCAGSPPIMADVARELGAQGTAAAVCVLAHSYDGKVPQAAVVTNVCSKREFAEAWAEIAVEAEALVRAQRDGKARP